MTYLNTTLNCVQCINGGLVYSLAGCGIASLKNIDSSTPMKVGAVYGFTLNALIKYVYPFSTNINFKALLIFSF